MDIRCQEASAEGPPTVTAVGTSWAPSQGRVRAPWPGAPAATAWWQNKLGFMPCTTRACGWAECGGTSSPDSHCFLSGHRASRPVLRSCRAGSLVRIAFPSSEFASYSEYSDEVDGSGQKSTILCRPGALRWSSPPAVPISSSKNGFQKSALEFLRGGKC